SDPGGGSGHAEANGNGHGNGNGNGNGNSAAMLRATAASQRERLMPFVIQGMSQEMAETDALAEPLERVFVRPLPRWKRAMDILVASLLMVVLLPVLLATALIVKISSPGKVIFTQRRAGLGGKPFLIYKFRTMRHGAEDELPSLRSLSDQDGPAFKLGDDPRITRVGRFLRETSLDELPQLWNVLKGEMSLVGPRPL